MTRLTRDEKRLLKHAIKEANNERDYAIGMVRYYERLEFVEHHVHSRSLNDKQKDAYLNAHLDIARFTEVIAELESRLRGR